MVSGKSLPGVRFAYSVPSTVERFFLPSAHRAKQKSTCLREFAARNGFAAFAETKADIPFICCHAFEKASHI
jgi:hypothetical protein